MIKFTASDIQKLSLKEINALEAKLADAKNEAKERAKTEVREKINAILEASGLTLQDVFHTLKTKRKLPIKYINPDDRNQFWVGRGPRPQWLKAHIKDGKSLEDFEV
jgi:DNA-binding protein H-NS